MIECLNWPLLIFLHPCYQPEGDDHNLYDNQNMLANVTGFHLCLSAHSHVKLPRTLT